MDTSAWSIVGSGLAIAALTAAMLWHGHVLLRARAARQRRVPADDIAIGLMAVGMVAALALML